MRNLKKSLVSASVLLPGLWLAWSCGLPTNPAAPRWETQINLPLINKSYNILEEVVDKTDELVTDSLGNISFEFESTIDTFYVEDNLKLDGLTENFAQSLGTFEVGAQEQLGINVELRDMFAQADNLDGQQSPVPPFNFEIPTQEFAPIDNISWVEIASGAIDVAVVNNLPIALSGTTSMQIRDTATDTLVASAVLGENVLPNGGELSVTVDLSGKRISGALSVAVNGSTPGSPFQPVTIRADDGFAVNVTVSDFVVSGAAAKVDPVTIAQRDVISIDDSMVVTSASIKSGSLNFVLDGSIAIDSRIDFSLPNFVDELGDTLRQRIVLRGNSQTQVSIDLAGYTFRPSGAELGAQQVEVDWELTTLQSVNDIIEIRATDAISASFEVTQLVFSEVSGQFDSQQFDIPAQSLSVEVPDELDAISFADARLELTLYNTINFPATTDITIVGSNDAGEQSTMVVQQTIEPGGANGTAVASTLVFNAQNSAIVDLMNILPSSIEVSGVVDIGQEGYTGTVRATDNVSGAFKFSAPLAFELPAQSYDSEITETEIDLDIQQKIANNLESGSLFAKVNSHIPVGATIDIFFAASDSATFSSPGLSIGPLTIDGGNIDAQTGQVSVPQLSDLEIVLTKEELDFFVREKVFSGIRVSLPGTDGQTVRLLGSDFVQIQAYASFNLIVSEDLAD